TFFYLPKGEELELGVEGDAFVVQGLGARTDESCFVGGASVPRIRVSGGCDTVEVTLNSRGIVEKLTVDDLLIGMPSGTFRMPLGELLKRFPFRRIRAE